MTGIVFFGTKRLDDIVYWYKENLGMEIWLDQPDCTILKHGNLLLGFCQRDNAETEGTITIFFPKKQDVDAMYNSLSEIAITVPKENKRYRIYQFYAKDPEERTLEFQAFLHPVKTL